MIIILSEMDEDEGPLLSGILICMMSVIAVARGIFVTVRPGFDAAKNGAYIGAGLGGISIALYILTML